MKDEKPKNAAVPSDETDDELSASHTPLPWRVDHSITRTFDGRRDAHHWHLFSNAPGRDFIAGEASREANAEFIVCAVNAHDALVVALIKARLIIREWQGMGMSPEAEGDAWAIYDRNAPEMKAINAALALAEGNAPARDAETSAKR